MPTHWRLSILKAALAAKDRPKHHESKYLTCYAMRIAVTLDPDVEALLRNAARERGEPFEHVLNAAIREGLGGGGREAAKPFKQPTFNMGQPLVDLTKA